MMMNGHLYIIVYISLMDSFYPHWFLFIIDKFYSNIRILENGKMPKSPDGLDILSVTFIISEEMIVLIWDSDCKIELLIILYPVFVGDDGIEF